MLPAIGAPRKDLRINGILIRQQPPFVGDYCQTPDTKHVNDPCGHQATSCDGPTSKCGRCAFSYCAYHGPLHLRRFVAPRDAWIPMMKRLSDRLELVAKRKQHGTHAQVRVQLPAIADGE